MLLVLLAGLVRLELRVVLPVWALVALVQLGLKCQWRVKAGLSECAPANYAASMVVGLLMALAAYGIGYGARWLFERWRSRSGEAAQDPSPRL